MPNGRCDPISVFESQSHAGHRIASSALDQCEWLAAMGKHVGSIKRDGTGPNRRIRGI
jgi:hypothetical protein